MKKEKIKVTIDRLGIYGEGVARLDAFTLFVDGALPQERVSVDIYEQRKTFARARPLHWHETSPFRKEPVCPLFGKCGGCQLMHLDYAEQLSAKRDRVIDALERIGKLKTTVLECLASPDRLSYRNKIQLPVNSSGRLGLYAQNTHDIVEIDHCRIHCPLGEKILQQIQKLIKNEPERHLLKTVLIKTAVNTNQVLVVFVTSAPKLLSHLASKLLSLAPEIKGVVQNINPSLKNTILSSEYYTLAGQGWIEERLHGLYFKISPASFFQVNPAQAQVLYQTAIDYGQITKEDTLLDAYCGVGTLSLLSAQKAKQVIGIESVPEAIVDAQENGRRNQIENVSFFCAKVEERTDLISAADIVIVNPPRKGCEKAVLEALISNKVSRIVYISCDPATLARDLAILHLAGYKLEKVQPLDMFPQTMHVECVALLNKMK